MRRYPNAILVPPRGANWKQTRKGAGQNQALATCGISVRRHRTVPIGIGPRAGKATGIRDEMDYRRIVNTEGTGSVIRILKLGISRGDSEATGGRQRGKFIF